MATFDTAQFLAALTPPVFRHEGREIVGRFLSVPEYLALTDLVANTPTPTMRDTLRIHRKVADEIFPSTGDGPSVGEILETLPIPVQLAMVADFFECQVSVQTATLTAKTN